MQVRIEVEVVNRALTIVDKYKQAPTELKKLAIGERVVSRMILNSLDKLLEPFKDSLEEATPSRLRKLEHFLRVWGDELVDTSFLFCYYPHALANAALTALAEELSTVFPYTALELLLPNVQIPREYKTKFYNNFVVTSDGYFIDILKMLNFVRHDKDHRFLHPKTGEVDDNLPNLLEQHSTAAQKYSENVRSLFRASNDEKNKCDDLRDDGKGNGLIPFIEAGEFYERPYPAHKEAGKKRLMHIPTKNVKTINQLAELLSNEALILRDEWAEFLAAMDPEELLQITLPYRKILQKDTMTSIYDLAIGVTEWPQSDDTKRALVFIMNFIYYQERNNGPDRTGTFDLFGKGFTKEQTRAQAKAMMDFLQGNLHMLDLEAHLTKLAADGKILVINSSTCLALKNKILEAAKLCHPKPELKLEPEENPPEEIPKDTTDEVKPPFTLSPNPSQ